MPVSRLFGPPLALLAVLGASGCSNAVGQNPGFMGSVPADAPPRAAVQPPFPDVYDLPPRRPSKLMSEQERARIEAELNAARNRVDAQADALQKQRTGGNR